MRPQLARRSEGWCQVSNPRVDETETGSDPSKRSYFERRGWHGMIYRDMEGQERCPSQWHFPCNYCHRKWTPQELAAEERREMQRRNVEEERQVTLTENEQANMEREALDAHPDPEPEQYVYVKG
jgi:hypothetical protein